MANITEFYDFLHQMEDDKEYMIENNNYETLSDEGKEAYNEMLKFFDEKMPEYQNMITKILTNEN